MFVHLQGRESPGGPRRFCGRRGHAQVVCEAALPCRGALVAPAVRRSAYLSVVLRPAQEVLYIHPKTRPPKALVRSFGEPATLRHWDIECSGYSFWEMRCQQNTFHNVHSFPLAIVLSHERHNIRVLLAVFRFIFVLRKDMFLP